jgi:hypothetical protein
MPSPVRTDWITVATAGSAMDACQALGRSLGFLAEKLF